MVPLKLQNSELESSGELFKDFQGSKLIFLTDSTIAFHVDDNFFLSEYFSLMKF